VVAQQLNRADEQSAVAARSRFLEFWDREGRHHFQQEEEDLLPAFAAHGDPRHPLVLQVLGDHVAIRASAARVTATQAPSLEMLHQLGAELAAHVRLEERELFPMIEDAMPADELLALARALARG
jgi:DUF438 domain-containing protein